MLYKLTKDILEGIKNGKEESLFFFNRIRVRVRVTVRDRVKVRNTGLGLRTGLGL